MSGKNKKKFEACPNCGYKFTGVDNYCPSCGQENHDLNMPFSHVVLEVLEGTFHFDTKIFRTLKLLLFKPGQLTAAFIQNRRAPFVPPIRLYIFISFIFFLVLSADVLNKGREAQVRVKPDKVVSGKGIIFKQTYRDVETQGPIGFEIGGFDSQTLKQVPNATDQQLDSLLLSADMQPSSFNRNGLRKAGKFLALDNEAQIHKVFKMLSVMMFILMPLFALIMKSAYFRRKIHYIQFLIISLHYHCFVFIILTLAFLLEAFLGWDGFIGGSLLLAFIYLFFEQRHLFKQGIIKTFLKSVYTCGLYSFTLILFMTLALILSIALA